MNKIIFYQNPQARLKSIILLITIISVALGTAIYFSDKNFFIAFGLVIFSFFNFILFRKRIMKRPMVVVTQDGISNNTNGTGLVKWKYIEGFEIKQASNTSVLIININDHDNFLESKDPAARTLMKTNINKLGSPAIIPSIDFDKPLEEVLIILEKYHAEIKQKGTTA